MLCAVSSGIAGIHWAMTTSCARASAGRPSSPMNAPIAIASEPAIAAHPTSPAVVRLKNRMPTSPLIAAPAAGRSGINQIRSI